MNDEKFIVEKTFGNKSTLIHIENREEILNMSLRSNPTIRVFRIPPLAELQEVEVSVAFKEKLL